MHWAATAKPEMKSMNKSVLQNEIDDGLRILDSIGAAATSCLAQAIFTWPDQCDAVAYTRSLGISESISESQTTGLENTPEKIEEHSRGYIFQKLISRLLAADYSSSMQRKRAFESYRNTLAPRQVFIQVLDIIVKKALALEIETAIDYLVGLTSSWIMTCDEATIMRLSDLQGKHLVHPSNDILNRTLLNGIINELDDIAAIDLISRQARTSNPSG